MNPNVRIDDGDDIFCEMPRSYLTPAMLEKTPSEEGPNPPFNKRVFQFEMIEANCVYYDYFQKLFEEDRDKAIDVELRLLDAQHQLFNAIKSKKIIVYGRHWLRFREGFSEANVPEYIFDEAQFIQADPRRKSHAAAPAQE